MFGMQDCPIVSQQVVCVAMQQSGMEIDWKSERDTVQN